MRDLVCVFFKGAYQIILAFLLFLVSYNLKNNWLVTRVTEIFEK